jgi:TolA-binding protein
VRRARALAGQPSAETSIDQLLREGDAAAADNNLPRAVDRFMAVIHRSSADLTAPPAQRAMFSLSAAYAQQANFKGAVSGFRKLLELAPAGPHAAQARFELGLAYRRSPGRDPGETVRAQLRAAQELGAFVKSFPDHALVGEALVERALALADAGQHGPARAAAQAVLARFGSVPHFAGPARDLIARLDGQGDDPLAD